MNPLYLWLVSGVATHSLYLHNGWVCPNLKMNMMLSYVVSCLHQRPRWPWERRVLAQPQGQTSRNFDVGRTWVIGSSVVMRFPLIRPRQREVEKGSNQPKEALASVSRVLSNIMCASSKGQETDRSLLLSRFLLHLIAITHFCWVFNLDTWTQRENDPPAL